MTANRVSKHQLRNQEPHDSVTQQCRQRDRPDKISTTLVIPRGKERKPQSCAVAVRILMPGNADDEENTCDDSDTTPTRPLRRKRAGPKRSAVVATRKNARNQQYDSKYCERINHVCQGLKLSHVEPRNASFVIFISCVSCISWLHFRFPSGPIFTAPERLSFFIANDMARLRIDVDCMPRAISNISEMTKQRALVAFFDL